MLANDLPLIRAMARGTGPARWLALILLRRAGRQARARRSMNATRLGVPVPQALILSLTTRCPHRCAFCGAADYADGVDLSELVARRLVDEAEQLGTFAIGLVGGEPLLRPDLVFHLVRSHPRLLFLLFTSGSGVTPAVARQARAPNLLTLVGADAARPKAEAAREMLRGAGARFGFSAVVHETVASEFASAAFADHLRRAGCCAGVFFERLPIGQAMADGYGLTAGGRARFRDEIRLRERQTGMVLRFFPEEEQALGGCLAAGRGVLHINAKGEIEPCPFIHTAGENAGDRPLADLLRSPFLAAMRQRAGRDRTREHPCVLLEQLRPPSARDHASICGGEGRPQARTLERQRGPGCHQPARAEFFVKTVSNPSTDRND